MPHSSPLKTIPITCVLKGAASTFEADVAPDIRVHELIAGLTEARFLPPPTRDGSWTVVLRRTGECVPPSPRLDECGLKLGDEVVLILNHHGAGPAPFDTWVTLAPVVAAGPAAVAAVIYALKHLYGADLELKAYREQRRADYLAAQRLVREMEAKLLRTSEPPADTRDRTADDPMGSSTVHPL